MVYKTYDFCLKNVGDQLMEIKRVLIINFKSQHIPTQYNWYWLHIRFFILLQLWKCCSNHYFFKSVFQENEAKDLRASFTVQYNS